MRRARLIAALLLSAIAASMAGNWLTAPRPGIDRIASRVSDKDDFFAHPGDRQLLGDGVVMVTFLGTTTLLFDDGITQFLIDGFLTRPGMLRSLRVQTDAAVVDAALDAAGVEAKRLKAVFVSHSHFDHAMDVSYIVNKYPAAVLYGSRSVHEIGCGGGIPDARNRLITDGQETPLGDVADGFVVTALSSMHSPDPMFTGDIDECLHQPAWNWKYKEGGSYDFLVRHGNHTILFRGGANLSPPRTQRVDVLFISTGLVGEQDESFPKQYFENTVAHLRPQLVIPMHWDDFFVPLSGNLTFSMRMADDAPRAFDALIAQVAELNSQPGKPPVVFRLLQGYESVVLFRPTRSR